MKYPTRFVAFAPALLTIALHLAPLPVLGGGFSLFEQGARAMGMAGAFVAQADDPSALFYNVGGLAFLEEREIAVGLTLVNSFDEEFVGLPPVPGSAATGRLNSLAEPIPHFYWVQPTSRNWNFGLAVNSPFGLKTDWRDPDTFPGRFINTEASMLTIDVVPNIGFRLTERTGIGFGAIIRLSELEFNRRLPIPDPQTFMLVEVGEARLQSDLDEGFGWQVGLLQKTNESFSWGLTYRSTVTVDYAGDARFSQISTGNPMFDGLVATMIPFDQDLGIKTEIEFPDSATLGVALALSPTVLAEVDVNWTGWSSFDTLAISFVDAPVFNIVRPENWEDIYTYRIGARFTRPSGDEWRVGIAIDESPQPTAVVSPLLPDADRNTYAVGWGRRYDNRRRLDVALNYLDFDERVNDVSLDGFNGKYSQTGWVLNVTLGL
ncbi:MAG: outer membrane protein transport protein [Acidobacteriota bacterium]|nr:outer membrane protein transport protein [Acidobacteriota bacterium]